MNLNKLNKFLKILKKEAEEEWVPEARNTILFILYVLKISHNKEFLKIKHIFRKDGESQRPLEFHFPKYSSAN